jgi:hypothetical protein
MVAEPSGARIVWKGVDVSPFEDGKIKRKDVYSDSVAILRQGDALRVGAELSETSPRRLDFRAQRQ